MVKYFSQLHRKAQEPGDLNAGPPPAEDPTADLNMDEAPSEEPEGEGDDPDTGKDSVKFKLWAEKEAKKAGYTVEITPSSTGKATKVTMDDSTDIITQKDAIKLAVLLDENTMNWHLMDDPIVKGGGTWMIKFSKVEV